ncbi:MAG TPA: hypothetical protein VFC84_15410 [Desulfosporosinus sp.]|nr:hypothetical protein [Desulfosporosinus sp.]
MKILGKIKWFGSYNSKTDSYNDFGFILDGKTSIYFNIKSVLSKGASLDEGVWVTFNKQVDNSGREYAINVQLLKDEQDVLGLSNYFENNDWNIILEDSSLSKALFRYLTVSDIKYTEEIVLSNIKTLRKDKIKILLNQIYNKPLSIKIMEKGLSPGSFYKYLIVHKDKLYNLDKKNYVLSLKKTLVTLNKIEYWDEINSLEIIFDGSIWEITPPEVKVKILSRNNINKVINNELTRNIIDQIYHIILNLEEHRRVIILEKIPDHIKRDPKIFALLLPMKRLGILLKDINDQKLTIELEQEILEAFDMITEEEKFRIIKYVPDNLKLNFLLFKYLSPDEQVNLLFLMEETEIVKYWGLCKRKTMIIFIFRLFS